MFSAGGGRFYQPSVQYLSPTKTDRPIYTVTADVIFGRNVTRNGWLVVGGGVTVTRAWGEIIRLEGSISDGTFRSATYGSSATGVGASGLLRFEPFDIKGWRFGIETLGGFIIYSNHFPAGGDIYNFMGRIGPTVGVELSTDTHLRLSSHWMHVSNGQGLGPFNPSYEAMGAGLGLVRYF
ncbi:hypothetical protein [Turneriella parva]|uniref:Lipid A 3-O-deacylase-related protein n=1 Tax=Turneriella parva (strain ATCC BAA-1111 / DSM 21527 / NCTC 11395 / H) TaxID=869212 RepID=I4B4D3_TURPD|nr:hypothetical protein [Turneriella parva]AFM12140.1 hypothetical protein Turpa_1492 [Turneriella parva DSM 21527]